MLCLLPQLCTSRHLTSLNVSDDPTRSVVLRSSSGSFDVSGWSDADLYRLATLPKLRRWASNWARLLLSLCGPSLLWISDRSEFRLAFPSCGCVLPSVPSGSMDFDATLGFPGEGPSSLSACFSSWLAAPRLRLLVFRHGMECWLWFRLERCIPETLLI